MGTPWRIGVVVAGALLAVGLSGCTASVNVGGNGAPATSTPAATAPATPAAPSPAADVQVPGTVAAGGMVAFTAYTNFAGSIDKACDAIDRGKFVTAMTNFKVTKADALAGLDRFCKEHAHQTVAKEGAANGLLAFTLHGVGYGTAIICQSGKKDEMAAEMAQAMVEKKHPELTKAIFLELLDNSCPAPTA